jgi:glycerate dehydrogenase
MYKPKIFIAFFKLSYKVSYFSRKISKFEQLKSLTMQSNIKIVVLDSFVTAGNSSWPELQKLGDVTIFDRVSPEHVIDCCKGATAIFSNKVLMTREVIEALPELKFIGIMATGTNIVDFDAARAHGITVCNVPAYSTHAVVQHVFALLLNITNRVGDYASSVRNGDWANCIDFSYLLHPIDELNGRTMGIYGLGNIGSRVAAIAQALGMNVIALTSKKQQDLPTGIKAVNKHDLFAQADVLSLNAPLTDSNRGFVDALSLSLMKPSAIIINTARGGLVDEQALADALNNEKIFAAAVDVLSQEPPQHDNPLLSARNCFISPHVAWASKQARATLMHVCVANLEAWLAGAPQNVVC